MRHARSRAGTRIIWLPLVLFSPRVADRVRLSITSKGSLSAAVLATSCRPLRSPVMTAGFVAVTPATGVGIPGPLPKYLQRNPTLARTMHAAAAYKMTRCPSRAGHRFKPIELSKTFATRAEMIDPRINFRNRDLMACHALSETPRQDSRFDLGLGILLLTLD